MRLVYSLGWLGRMDIRFLLLLLLHLACMRALEFSSLSFLMVVHLDIQFHCGRDLQVCVFLGWAGMNLVGERREEC